MSDRGNAAAHNVTLYTSLPLKTERVASGRELGTDYQRACIASWRKQGFNVISLNPRSEIDALAKVGYDVIFQEVASIRPRIIDFLHIVQESQASISGIINADCMFGCSDDVNRLLLKFAEKGLVLVERLNLRACDTHATGLGCYGFDFLCFATELLPKLEMDDEISIGTPWWDYWFPLCYQQAGGSLFALPAPILMHLDHPQNWSRRKWLVQGQRMHAALSCRPPINCALPFVRYGLDRELTEAEIDRFAMDTFRWLKDTATAVDIDEPSAWFSLALLAGIDQVPKDLSERDRQIEEFQGMLAERETVLGEIEANLHATRAKLGAIEESMAWRLTRPLRAVAGWFGSRINGKGMLR